MIQTAFKIIYKSLTQTPNNAQFSETWNVYTEIAQDINQRVSSPEDIIDQEAGRSNIFQMSTQSYHTFEGTCQRKQQTKQKINSTQRISFWILLQSPSVTKWLHFWKQIFNSMTSWLKKNQAKTKQTKKSQCLHGMSIISSEWMLSVVTWTDTLV